MNHIALWVSVVLICVGGMLWAPTLLTHVSNDEGYVVGSGGARLFYRVEGAHPDTVVVVHGGPGAGMDAVRPDLGPLAASRTVVYYDQRGGGHSTLPADTTQLGPEYFVGDLEAVRQFFGLSQMNVIAHSFGSVVVAEYARRHPDRLGRIVFLGATGPRRTTAAALAREGAQRYAEVDSTLLRRMYEPMAALMSGTAEDPVAACEAYHAGGARVAAALGRPPSNAKGSECLMEPEALRYYFRYTAQVGPALFGDWDYTSGLDALSAPLLVIYGDDDARALGVQREWVGAVPRGRLLIVKEAGKGAHVDRPDIVFPAIDVFLDGQWPRGAEQ